MSENNITEFTEKIVGAGLWQQTSAGIVFRPASFQGNVPNSHQFSFADAPWKLPHETICQMHTIAANLPAYYDMLKNLGEQLPTTGISSQYGDLKIEGWMPPPVTMIDAMITADGEVKIAEVDVVNPRGLGYLALYDLIYGNDIAAPALRAIVSDAEQHGNKFSLLCGTMQGFYLPYYQLLQTYLSTKGVDCEVVAEKDIKFGSPMVPKVGSDQWAPGRLLDFPQLKKATKKSYGPLAKWLVDKYGSDDISFLYPPQPHLSSKLLLAAAYDEGIFGDNLPTTRLHRSVESAQDALASGKYCVKAAISSGMKGLWLPYSQIADSVKGPVITQELVDNQMTFEITHATGGSPGWALGKFAARLSLFVGADGTLLASDVTAQPFEGKVKGIHGNPDCVLIPVTI